VDLTRAARAGGAYTLAVTNDAASPLAAAADATLDIHAGPELSVAATKTFVTSALSCLWLVAELVGDADLLGAIRGLPERLAEAVAVDWSAVAGAVGGVALHAGAGAVLGDLERGGAEVQGGLPAPRRKLFLGGGAARAGLHRRSRLPGPGLRRRRCRREGTGGGRRCAGREGASVFATTDRVREAERLPFVRTGHPLTDPLALIVSFYAMIEGVAVARGLDPDMPRHLQQGDRDDLRGRATNGRRTAVFLVGNLQISRTENLVFRPLSFPAAGPRRPRPPCPRSGCAPPRRRVRG
jgi:glucosamine--fructose-6-phosphate aminotransferase (isomerizing)